ncbi:UDP-glucose 4-epimerase-like isoform X3 [Artemia franciscana]
MPPFKTVFVTGGAGYIGSHTVLELVEAGYEVIAVDNFTNCVCGTEGQAASLKRVEEITGKKITFYQCDLLDKPRLAEIFKKHKIDCVIHFAAMKAVGESMILPLLYYKNNLIGTINLLEVMKENNCLQLLFSSSCTIYGNPDHLPINEKHSIGNVTNVYGRTKYIIEEMLVDLSKAEPEWNIISLRYFNPVGAHHSGRMGEDPTKAFTNIMPYIGSVAIGRKPYLTVFGDDYNTPDGTGVRDYIHVMDLASGHVAAMAKLAASHLKIKAYNLGTGRGVTVLELVRTFEKVTKTKVPVQMLPRREGDIESMFADATLACEELGWTAERSLETMCEDYWRWQIANPNGYRETDTADVAAKLAAIKESHGECSCQSTVNGVH